MQGEENNKVSYFVNLSIYSAYLLTCTFWDALFIRILLSSGRWYSVYFFVLFAIFLLRFYSIYLLAHKKILFEIFFGLTILLYFLYLRGLRSIVKNVFIIIGNWKVFIMPFSMLFLIIGILLSFYGEFCNYFRSAFDFPLKQRRKDITKGADMFRPTEKAERHTSETSPDDNISQH